MEWLNLVALIAITFSNLYIGIHVRNQQISKEEKFEDARIAALHLEAALKNALSTLPEQKAPVVTVLAEPSDVKFELDYDKLSAAVRDALIESHIAVHNASVDAPPAPLVSDPALITSVISSGTKVPPPLDEFNGVPITQFPAR